MPTLPNCDVVVADTSPLLFLHVAGLLPLLPQLHGPVLVPQVVVNEIHDGLEVGKPGPVFQSIPGYNIMSDRDDDLALLPFSLDPGERAALTLAMLMPKQALVLIDERRGRRAAEALALRHIGTLGIILALKRAALITLVGPALERIAGAGARLDPALLALVRERAGEG